MRSTAEGGHWPSESACLYLFFGAGQQPAPGQVAEALARANAGIVSHQPETRGSDVYEEEAVDWIELLSDGLTFDLIGLAPGRGLGPVEPDQTLGLSREDLAECEIVGLAPGPHLAGAANALPVVRTMLRLGATLLAPGMHGVGALWRPSGLASDLRRFLPAVENWLDGGPFPAPLMIRMSMVDGALETSGLNFFLGCELRVDSAWKQGADAARIVTRIADRLITSGRPDSAATALLDDGTRVRLVPQGQLIVLGPG